MRCIFTNRTIGMASFWYQSYHWYKWTIGLTNRIRLCILDMYGSSSPVARLSLAKNEAPEEEDDLGLCCNQMLDACWQRFEPRNIDFKKFLFQLRHVSKVHSNN